MHIAQFRQYKSTIAAAYSCILLNSVLQQLDSTQKLQLPLPKQSLCALLSCLIAFLKVLFMYFFTSLKTKIWINSARDVSINNLLEAKFQQIFDTKI